MCCAVVLHVACSGGEGGGGRFINTKYRVARLELICHFEESFP